MKIVSKTILALVVSLLSSVLVLGVIAFLSMKSVGETAIRKSEEEILSNKRMSLSEQTQSKAAELNRFFTQYHDDVEFLRGYYRYVSENDGRFQAGAAENLYPEKPAQGFPGYGYVRPEYGTYADFEHRGAGAPWMPKRTVRKALSDGRYRAAVSRQIREVTRLNHVFSSMGKKFAGTLDLVWVVLDSGVTNVFPPYDYYDVIKNDPSIVDLNESEEDYVRLLNPENNPERAIKWIDPYFDHFKRIWMTSCIAPLYDGNDFLGTIGMDILLPTITEIIHQIGDGGEEYAFLISNTGKPIAISERGIDDLLWEESSKKAFRQTYLPPDKQQWDEGVTSALSLISLDRTPDKNFRKIVTDMVGGGTGTRTIALSGQDKLVSYAPIANTGWSIGLVIPMETVLAASNAMKSAIDQGTWEVILNFSAFAVMSIVVSFLFGSYLHYRVVNPLVILSQNIQKMSWDNLSLPADDRSTQDEVGALHQKFDEMIKVLKRAKDEIVEKNEQLQQFAEELEQKVNERTAQLETRNRDLDAFSYTISHDLRAPLRVISGFSDILLKDHKSELNEEGRYLLEKIIQGTVRMSRLMERILQLARLGRREMSFSNVDMKAEAMAAFAEIMTSAKDRKIRFDVGELPSVIGDEDQLYQCWSNLLANAVKFTSIREDVWIEISGWKENGEIVYRVKDNGAGFDMKDVGKLFGEFQRLHGEKDFEGTGAGLAIVKRVVERHGGRVWAEGKVGEGAAFYFSLPANGQPA